MITKVLAFAALAIVALSAAESEAVYCNSPNPRCVTALAWDSNSLACLDVKASTSCTPVCKYGGGGTCSVWNSYYAAGCMDTGTNTCATIGLLEDESEDVAGIEEAMETCSGTGYCGWRDGSNKSPSAGVAHAARAKLHSCAQNGYSDEATYDTLFECTTSNPHTKNLYCTDVVWDTLCNEWL